MSSRSWFSARLLPWYREHKRPLPWRGTRDPYRIWLSEVILQQTRVDQGLAYYERFADRYPTVADLAAAREDDVLKLWQGLGYYSRARNLRTAAQQVVSEWGGEFPQEHTALLKLKGVGDYTASAIASIAFDVPEAVLDGNVYRVLARVFGIDTPIDSSRGKTQFRSLAQELIDRKQPGDHNQAVMELGATVCTPKNPTCMFCPIRSKCIALATGRIAELPVKEGRTKVTERFFNYLYIRTATGLLLHQRTAKDIWQGLFELPLIESKAGLSSRKLLEALEASTGKEGWKIVDQSTEVKHVLSHRIIRATFWEVLPPKGYKRPTEWSAVPDDRITDHAVPRLIDRWLAERK